MSCRQGSGHDKKETIGCYYLLPQDVDCNKSITLPSGITSLEDWLINNQDSPERVTSEACLSRAKTIATGIIVPLLHQKSQTIPIRVIN